MKHLIETTEREFELLGELAEVGIALPRRTGLGWQCGHCQQYFADLGELVEHLRILGDRSAEPEIITLAQLEAMD